MHLDARFGQLLHCFPGIHCIITQSQYRIVQKTVLACDISVFQANPRFTVTEGTQKKHDRFHCRDCLRVFQLTYCYEARKPGVKDQITEIAFNDAGVSDTAHTLKIGINTISRT